MDNTIGDNGIFRILLTCQYNNQFTVLFQYRSFHILDIIDTLFAELKGKIVCRDFSLLTGCYVYLTTIDHNHRCSVYKMPKGKNFGLKLS